MSRATVHHLAVAVEEPDAPAVAVVEHLRDLLARAEKGEIRALAIVAQCNDSTIEYGHINSAEAGAWAPLLAGLVCVQAQLVQGQQ